MSADLGSASGKISIEAGGVARGLDQAANAVSAFIAQVSKIDGLSFAPKLDVGKLEAGASAAANAVEAVADAAEQMGSAAARGVQMALPGFEQLDRAAENAGNAIEHTAQSTKAGLSAVATGSDQAAAAVDRVAKQTQSASQAFDQLGNTAGVIGGALAAGLGLAVKSAGDLETAVTRISTIAPEIDVSQVSQQLSQLSIDVGTSATDLASAMNNVFSSIETNQSGALKLTEQFAKGAIAAGADAETFGSAILGVLNAYGLSVDQASHVSDVFFNTLDKGVIGGQQLASGLGQVTQAAKQAGVDFDTLGALIAGVTREGGDASTNVNNLSNALGKIVTADTQAGLQKLGIATKDSAGNFRNIVDVLTELDAKLKSLSAGDRTKVLQELFPDVQARSGISVLLNQLGTVSDVMKSNAAAAGVADRAYERMAGTAQAAGARLKASLVATLTEAGNIALPGLESIAKSVQGALEGFGNLSPGVRETAVQATAAAAALLLVSSAAIKVGSTVVQAVAGIRAIATALPLLTSAASSAFLALGPLIVALGSLEFASRAITGESFVTFARSLLTYGDALHKAREDADRFTAGKPAIADYAQEIANLDTKIKALTETNARFADFSPEAIKDLFSGDAVRRNKELNEAIKEREILTSRMQAMQASQPVLGPPAPPYGPFIQEAKDYAAQLEKLRSLRQEPTPIAPQANAGAQQFEANVGNTATQQLNEQSGAAIKAQEALTGYQNALNDAAASNAAAASRIQGQIGPMTAALDQLNAKRAQGLPITAAETQLLQQLPGAIGQATNAYNDLAIAGGRIAEYNQQLAAQSGQGSAAFAGYGGEIQALVGQFNELTGAIAAANSAASAFAQRNSKLGGDYNVLEDQAKVLEAKKKAGTASAEELGILENIRRVQGEIGAEMAANEDKRRAEILAAHELEKAERAKAEAIRATKAAQDAITQNDKFTTREDRRVATGPDITPPPPANLFKPEPVVVPVKVDPNAKAQIEGELAGFTYTGPPIKVPVEAELKKTGAELGARALAEFGGQDNIKQSITIDVKDNATVPIGNIKNAVATLGQTAATPTVSVTDLATDTIAAVTGKLGTLGASSATPTANLTDNASGPLGEIQGLVDGLDGRDIHITASVDTSAAIAAVSDLRAYMPSSPADKGPFHKLPEWQSIFDSLGPAGDFALATIESSTDQMARTIATGIEGAARAAEGTRGPMGVLAGMLGGSLDEAAIKSAKESADAVRSIADAAKGYAEAIRALAGLDTSGIGNAGALRDGISVLVRAFVDAAAEFEGDGLKAASELAGTASSIVGLIEPAVEGFSALQRIVEPTGDQIGIFAAGVGNLVLIMAETAALFSADGLAGADLLAETAAKVLALLLPAIEGFAKLPRIIEPTADQIGVFAAGVTNLTLILADSAKLFTQDGLAGAGAIADVAAKVLALLIPAVDGFAKLPGIMEPTADQIGVFAAGVTNLTLILAESARLFTAEGLAAAGDLADVAAKVLALILPAIEGFAALPGIVEPTAAQVGIFGRGIVAIVTAIAQAAALFDADLLTHAAAFADAAAKAIALIGPALDAVGRLGEGDLAVPDAGRLATLASAIRAIVAAIAALASTMSVEGVAAGAAFSDAATKMVSLVGAAVSGFADLSSFDGVSDAQIAGLVDAIDRTIRALLVVAARFDQKAVEVGAAFASSASTMVGLIGSAMSALTTDVDKEGKPTRRFLSGEEIDQLIAVVEYAARRLVSVAGGFDKGQLATISAFGDALGRGFAALRGAMDAISITTDDKPKENSLSPAQVIEQLIAALTAGAARLPELVTLAEQYRNAGVLVRQALAEVQGMTAGALLPTDALSPALLAAGGTTTIVIRQERVFTGTLTLNMPADDGAFVARSLRIDGKSRGEVADMLMGEIVAGGGEFVGA